MSDVTAILLAAGLSRRMGARNKLLLPIRGEALVRRVARAYLGVLDGPLTVVTGFDAGRVQQALAGLPVHFAHNDRFADGQPGSVATGLAHAADANLLLVGLADQPLLTTADLRQLLDAHAAGDPGRITIPMQGARRGNPIVIPRSLRARLTENPERPGCMQFTRENPESVQAAPLGAPGFYADIDTPEDYDLLEKNHTEATACSDFSAGFDPRCASSG